jgi:hypothetical protein
LPRDGRIGIAVDIIIINCITDAALMADITSRAVIAGASVEDPEEYEKHLKRQSEEEREKREVRRCYNYYLRPPLPTIFCTIW